MPDYIVTPIESDPDALAQQAFEALDSHFPGWLPAPGNLDTILLETAARMTAQAADVAAQVGPEIFRWFGANLVGIPPEDPAQAVAQTTWTMTDSLGHVVPEGTVIRMSKSAEEWVYFETVVEFEVPNGSSATAAGAVQVRAVDAGVVEFATPPAVQIVDALAYVASVALVGTVTGGLDGEDTPVYLNRLREELTLFTPRPILPRDFEILAVRVPGVSRAVAIDQYNPDHNQLSANQSSLETDTTGWAADGNCSIARTTAAFLYGAASLRLTATAAGTLYAASTPTGVSGEPVQGNGIYTALASFKTNGGARSCQVEIKWYSAAGALLATTTGTPVATSAASYTQASLTALAPATAAFAAVRTTVVATGVTAGETTDVDGIAFHEGESLLWELGTNAGGSGYARYLSLAAADEAGQPVSPSVQAALESYLDSLRELNFVVRTIDPILTSVAVAFTAKCYPSFEPADVEARAELAVAAFLDPATWGLPPTGDSNDWILEKVVRFFDVTQAIQATEGLWYIQTCTVNGGLVDVTLPGVAPLPTPGAITGTVTL
jgi:hypothetical protein